MRETSCFRIFLVTFQMSLTLIKVVTVDFSLLQM